MILCEGMESIGEAGGSGAAYLASLFLAFQLQKLLDDVVGIHLQLVIEMVLQFCLQFGVTAVYAEVALREGGGTWYLRIDDSLSLERSNRSYTLLLAISQYNEIIKLEGLHTHLST